MGWIIGGAIFLASTISAYMSSEAAEDAGEVISETVDEQQVILDELLSPYEEAGKQALEEQQILMGLGGDEAQQSAIDEIAGGAEFGALQQQGENAILQNASATGGLRGGNTQGALGQFRPALLNSLIDKRLGQLGAVVGLGQNTALNEAQIGSDLAVGGANAEADAITGGADAWSDYISDLTLGAGTLAGLDSQGYFGGDSETETGGF